MENLNTVTPVETVAEVVPALSVKSTKSVKRGRGRPSTMTKEKIVSLLRQIESGEKIESRHFLWVLEQRGMISMEKDSSARKPGRGRTPITPKIIGKGRSFLALSKTWKTVA